MQTHTEQIGKFTWHNDLAERQEFAVLKVPKDTYLSTCCFPVNNSTQQYDRSTRTLLIPPY